jgi:hypothetical protein
MRKNIRGPSRGKTMHPLSPGRPSSPLLKEISGAFPKSLNDMANNPGLVNIKPVFFL